LQKECNIKITAAQNILTTCANGINDSKIFVIAPINGIIQPLTRRVNRMKNSKLFVAVVMILAVAGMFIGCAKPPEADKTAAKTAMEAAVSAEAPRYASADYAAAVKIWDTSEAQMKEKKYGEAKQGYIDARAAFEKASAAVPAGKKALVGEVSTDELKAAVARLEADWKNLQTLARKVEAKIKKKKLWEIDAKTLSVGLKAAKDILATDPISTKIKIDALRPLIDSYTKRFKQLEAAR
jgi:hypothetical protein